MLDTRGDDHHAPAEARGAQADEEAKEKLVEAWIEDGRAKTRHLQIETNRQLGQLNRIPDDAHVIEWPAALAAANKKLQSIAWDWRCVARDFRQYMYGDEDDGPRACSV
jgi:hypothetical protein